VEDPLSEEILRGNFKGKDLVRITVKTEEGGEKHLYFDAVNSADEKAAAESNVTAPAAASDAT